MVLQAASWAAVVVLAAAGAGLLLSRDWRWRLGLLAVQYAAAFILILGYWPLGMAAVKLITGWIATALLGMTRQNLLVEEPDHEFEWSGSRAFILTSAFINVLIAFAAGPRLGGLIPGIGLPLTIGSLLLMGTGLIQLGLTGRLLRVITGLLTLLCGFEILYAAVESSILVSGLLAVVNLSLALAGAYLLINSVQPEPEESL